MPPPYAIRVRTADGWQDIALVGPPGPQGVQGNPGAVVIYEQPNAPSSPQVGQIWIDTDDNIPSGSVVPRRTGFTWAIKGAILAETQPSFFVPVAAGQVSRLIGVRCKLASGGSIACQLTRYGSNIGTPFTVTPTLITTNFAPITLVDGDDIGLVTSSPSSSPTTLTVTAIMEHYT
jgi:hypothetical protein